MTSAAPVPFQRRVRRQYLATPGHKRPPRDAAPHHLPLTALHNFNAAFRLVDIYWRVAAAMPMRMSADSTMSIYRFRIRSTAHIRDIH